MEEHSRLGRGAVAIRYASWLNMTEATVRDNLA